MRLCTIKVPLFAHGGLTVSEAWTNFDLAKMPAKAREALIEFTGRFIQVHPADIGELAAAGLVLQEGKLVAAKPPAPVPAPQQQAGKR